MMRNWMTILCLALALMLCGAGLAMAEEDEAYEVYGLGDTMEDFTAKLADGTEVTLSELLETRQAVLINFWATWCGPCRMEFPYMREAYLKAQDQVAVVALSIEPTDTDEVIRQFQEENDLADLPMGQDTIGLGDRFEFDGIPTSIMVDRFGVICWQESGSITSTDTFDRLFSGFLGDDYTESKADYEIPAPKPTVDAISEEELSAALNVEGGVLTFANPDDEEIWPFVAGENGELVSSNKGADDTLCSVSAKVSAKAGDALVFDYATSTELCCDSLVVRVNGKDVMAFSGENDWTTYAVGFDADGDCEVTLSYIKDSASADGNDCVRIDNVRLLTGDAAKEALAAMPAYPRALEGENYDILPADETVKEVVFVNDGDRYRSLFGSAKSYVASGDTASFKVRLGAELNPGLAAVMGDYDGKFIDLCHAERDEEGYFVTLNLSKVENGGYSNTYVYVFPKMAEDPDENTMIYVYANEQNVNAYCQELANEYQMTGVSWTYADGTKPSTDEVAQAPVEESAEVDGEALADYQIAFVDQDGNPVEGVMAQVCDDSTCEVYPSDADGLVNFQKAPYAYEIHVLTLPEGYEFDTTQTFTMQEAGGELTIELTKAA